MTGDLEARIQQLDRAISELVLVIRSTGANITDADIQAIRHILVRMMG